jgi:hypothetical protein
MKMWTRLLPLLAAGVALLWWLDPAQMPLPLCGLHALTGLYCPGCGATRATHALLHGHLMEALHDNALWVLSLPLALYAGLSEWRWQTAGRPLWGDPSHRPSLIAIVGAAALLFFVLRNVPVYPLVLLAPPG